MSGTTPKGVPFPEGDDPALGPEQMHDIAVWLDDHPGISTATYAEIAALTGADEWEGRAIWQEDTGVARPREGLYLFNGVRWAKPWNMPWGDMPNGLAEIAAETGLQAGLFDIGLSLTNTYIANRRIRVELQLPWCAQGSGGQPEIFIHDGTTSHIVWTADVGPGAVFSPGTCGLTFDTTAGSKTYKAQGNGNGGQMNVKAFTDHHAQMTIRDVGPSGAPA